MKILLVMLLAAFCSFNVIASPVNINTADAKTISEALSGIGLKKAEAIVKYREEKGAFKTVDELVNVKTVYDCIPTGCYTSTIRSENSGGIQFRSLCVF